MNMAGFTTESLFHLMFHSRDYKETNKLLSEWTTPKPQLQLPGWIKFYCPFRTLLPWSASRWRKVIRKHVVFCFMCRSWSSCITWRARAVSRWRRTWSWQKVWSWWCCPVTMTTHANSGCGTRHHYLVLPGARTWLLEYLYSEVLLAQGHDCQNTRGSSWRKEMAAGIPVFWGPCWLKDTTARTPVVSLAQGRGARMRFLLAQQLGCCKRCTRMASPF